MFLLLIDSNVFSPQKALRALKIKKLYIKLRTHLTSLSSVFIMAAVHLDTHAIVQSPFQSIETIEGHSISTTALYSDGDELWIGSLNGLAMIRPGERRVFNTSTGDLRADHISGITKDINGTVWASIYGGGVFFVNIESNTSGQVRETFSFNNEKCYDLLSLDSGREILISCNSELASYKVMEKEFSVLAIPEAASLKVRDLAVLDENNLILGSWGNGLFKLDRKSLKLTALNVDASHINDIQTSSDGNILVSSTSGAFIYYSGLDTSKKISKKINNEIWDEDVETILELERGKYLLSFMTHGLYIYDEETEILEKPEHLFPLLHFSATGVVADVSFIRGQESLVVGTLDRGVYILPYHSSFIRYFDSAELYPSNISLVQNTDKKHFIGDSFNLYEMTPTNSGLNTFIEGIGFTYFITKVGLNNWIVSSHERGLVKVDGLGNVLSEQVSFPGLPSEDGVHYAEVLKTGEFNYILGTDFGNSRGLYVGNFTEGFSQIHKDITVVEMFMLNDIEALILTAFKGIKLLNIDSQKIQTFPLQTANDFTDCIEQLNEHLFFICVRRNKAQIFDLKTKSYSDFEPENMEIRNVRTAELDRFQNLWLASSRGLFVYNLESKEIIKVTEAEGVFSTEFSSDMSLMIDDTLILPGNKGIISIDTKKANAYFEAKRQSITKSSITKLNYILSDQAEQRPVLTEIKNNSIQVPYDNILLRIQLSHDNLLEVNQLRYETRLVGLSDEWEQLEVNKHTTSYTTLPPGEYQFQARIVDPRSNAVQPTTALTINVTPPWWETVWAYIAYVLILLSVIYFISWYRNKRLIAINERLTAKVKERTNTITKLLQQKQTFFANVSHEFRTPLALISGPLDTIAEKLKEPATLRQIAVMRRNTARLKGLVDQILELAKFETSSSLPKQVYDLKSSVEVISSSFTSLLEQNQQQLSIKHLPSVRIKLIEDTLEMVLSNLISNAIKYSGNGTVITIEGYQSDSIITLKVSDNGKGISEENQELLFERFTRFDADEKLPGSGIGLALVKQIVQSNDGSISVESKPGEGTSFFVNFPDNVGQDEEITQVSKVQILDSELNSISMHNIELQTPTATLPDTDEDNNEKFKILIVEDNPDLRSFISESLASEFELELAENGEQGLKKAQENIPDLILSDILMPKMDGYELANAIRSEQATSHIPIILLTAKGDDLSRMKGWEEQVDDYLTKPFKLKELKLRINRLLTIRDILRKKHTSELHNKLATKNQQAISFQSKRDLEFFNRFEAVIEKHYQNEHFSRPEAASELAMSVRQLNRKLAALVDYNFAEYLRKYRLQKSRELLLSGRQITEVAYDVGFNSPSYFSNCFKAEFNKTPKRYVEDLEQQ